MHNSSVTSETMTEQAPLQLYSPEEVEAMLSMATTGELGASYRDPAVAIWDLTATEIYSAVHHVEDARSRVPTMKSDPRIPDPRDERLAKYGHELETAFQNLQDFVDQVKARDVFTMLVGSSSPLDKQFAGTYIGTLTRVDHDYGIELWERLLEDENHRVAAHTWGVATALYLDSDRPEEIGASLVDHGITWEDFQNLTHTYVRRLEDFRERNTYPDGYAA